MRCINDVIQLTCDAAATVEGEGRIRRKHKAESEQPTSKDEHSETVKRNKRRVLYEIIYNVHNEYGEKKSTSIEIEKKTYR